MTPDGCEVIIAWWSEHQPLKLEVLGSILGGCVFQPAYFPLFAELESALVHRWLLSMVLWCRRLLSSVVG